MSGIPLDVEPSLPTGWELVVGLEVHVELKTKSKLFCGCANLFGSPPNSNVCPTCLGLPGSLPLMNERAIELAMMLGRALECEINPSVMARKNYFYPDMPKNYQISQYDQPTNTAGRLVLPDGFAVGIERIHIEEDTGKTIHVGQGKRIGQAQYCLIDYNRAGVPLVEIVSKPDINTAARACDFVEELKAILVSTGVSDARAEEGSMRVDANVSVRPSGSDALRTRCEIKNINSVRSLGRAIIHEALRHVDLWENGESPSQETRHWDEDAQRTTAGRSKEDADDYRYFQEPDLLPLEPSWELVAAIDEALPALPAARRAALQEATGADIGSARILVERGQDELALETVASGADAEKTITRLVHDLAIEGWENVGATNLASVVEMESANKLSASQAKQVLADLAQLGGDVKQHIARRGYERVEEDALSTLLDKLITDNPVEWSRFCGADRHKMQGFFTGQIMKATRGQANGAEVARLLEERRANSLHP